MKNQIQVFRNEEFGEIRTVEINGQTWFVGKDVANALGYEAERNALKKHVDDEDKLTHRISASGQIRSVIITNESGLYSLILSSKLPSAKQFKRWVTSEVLPTIRKTGAYVTDELLDKLADSEGERTALVEALQKERADRRREQMQFKRKSENSEKTFAALRNECVDLREENGILEDCIGELLPSAEYCDTILQAKNAIPVSVIASEYGLSAVVFNRLLHEVGIQRKVGGTWILYSRYNDCGYTVLRTYQISSDESSNHTYWTQRGRKFLHDTLREYGIIPMVERVEGIQIEIFI